MNNLIGDFLRRQAERIPERECQVFGEKRYTYRQVNREANRLSNAFLNSGLLPGDHVGVFSSNCIEYLLAFWGAAKAGVVLVHFNSRLTENELSDLVQHADVKILLFHGDFMERVEKTKNLMKPPPGFRWVCFGSRCTASWVTDFTSFLQDGEIQEFLARCQRGVILGLDQDFTAGNTHRRGDPVFRSHHDTLDNSLSANIHIRHA